MNLLIRLAIAALSLFVAAWLIPDIYIEGSTPWMVYAGMAVVLGLVNLLVKPILNLLTCPIQLITLGLFSLIVNAVAFWLASYLAVNVLDIGFHVDGFLAAFLGALVVSILTPILSKVLLDRA
ncbi:MAG: phage holin family protein [Chloroflexi bacterium]|nr:phage holin family protein [Chloroflexota bacterium]